MLARIFRTVPVLLFSGSIAACAAAAAGGAGAAAGVYAESRGAEGVVEGSVPDVASRAERVFTDLGITVTERDYDYDEGEVDIRGRTGGMDVDVDIERASDTTSRVHVEARRSAVEWDQDYARMVLDRIVTGN